MNWISLVVFICICSTTLLIILLVSILGKKNKRATEWSLVALILASLGSVLAYTSSNFMAYQANPISLLPSLGGLMVLCAAIIFYIFYEFFPVGSQTNNSKYRILAIVLFGTILAYLQFTTEYLTNQRLVDGVVISDRGWPFIVAGIGITLIALAALVNLAYKYKRIKDLRTRMHIRFIIGGNLAILFLTFIFTYFLPLLGIEALSFIGMNAFMLLFPVIGYIIINHRFMDIQSGLLRIVLWIVIIALPTLVLAGVILFTELLSSAPARMLAFISLLVVLQIYMTKVQPWIKGRIFGDRTISQEVLTRFILELQAIEENDQTLGGFLDRLLSCLHAGLEIEKGFVVAIDRFKRIAISKVGELPDSFHRNTGLVLNRNLKLPAEMSEELNRVFLLEDQENKPFSSNEKLKQKYPRLIKKFEQRIKSFEQNGFQIFVPLIFRSELCGYIVLGNKENGMPYFNTDLSMMEAIRHSMAMALRNYIYYEEIVLLKNQAENQTEELSSIITNRAIMNQQEVISHELADKRLVFSSHLMSEVYNNVKEAAPQQFPVLISGETGTGKELIAQLLHDESKSSGPFVPVNCAAIPHDLWESHVFGHKKGAFTDAKSDKQGFVHQAKDGTLFFDEIGEMPLEVQPKILRLLQEKSFRSLGSNELEEMQSRLVFATNRDLNDMVQKGLFRKDLYYRISVLRIKLPALRERIEDIPALVEFMLPKYTRELGKEINYIEKGALDALCRYHWAGNIRELENVLIQSILSCKSEAITFHNLPLQIRESRKTIISLDSDKINKNNNSQNHALGVRNFKDLVDEYMRSVIEQALRESGGSGPKAADLLGMKPGKLYYQMGKLGVKK